MAKYFVAPEENEFETKSRKENKMRINEAINAVRKKQGWSLRQLATAIGKNRPNDVSARLASKNMSFNNAIEMLSVMGYEVIVQPVTVGERKDGAIVIEGSGE